MTPEYFNVNALSPAMDLLPVKLDTLEARAMVIAICLQESKLLHRHQIGGPAHGYAQFEKGGGVVGVLTHHASKPLIRPVLAGLDYGPTADAAACYAAIEHNDILAAAFARLLLYTLPDPLPAQNNAQEGWRQYIAAWRPGKPHPETWAAYFARAWVAVE